MIKYIDASQLALFKKSLAGIRIKIGEKDVDSIDQTYGVEGNTFRAYSGYEMAPSLVFREWAMCETRKIKEKQPTKEISSKSNFDLWHSGLANSLEKHWKKEQGSSLSFAHTYKLIDLYIKWLSQFKFTDLNFAKNLNKYAFCALDKQTLNKINLCYSQCMPINAPSMGHIYNEKTYEFCQNIINTFCESANATSLEFDYWAWKKGG